MIHFQIFKSQIKYHSGISNVINDGIEIDKFKRLVPISSPEMLADSIMEAINEKNKMIERWARKKINCRKRVIRYYSIKRMIKEYNQIWSLNIS